jgi:flagellar secretion chaperone FliS
MDARSSYREAAVRGASPVGLVICLYEQAIEDLRQAVIALEKNDIEARTRGINHALMVIAQLQGSLDMERGGEVARNLARFYSVVRAGLNEAQMKQSARILEQQISQLVTVHEAWLEVERATATPQPLPAEPTLPKPAILSTETSEAPLVEWNA